MTGAEGAVALITGAAGGIGQALAEVFFERGARGLVLVDLDQHQLGDALAALRDRTAGREVDVLAVAADVSDRSELSAAFAEGIERFGSIDIVCNNAATQTWQPAYPHADLDAVERVIDVNVRGVVLGCQLAFDHMAANGGGSIVNTASGAGKVPMPSDPLYSASKAAVVMLTKASAPRFEKAGVRINAVCPSLVDTSMLDRSVAGVPALEAAAASMPKLTAREVAEAIADVATNPDQTGQTPSLQPKGQVS